MYGIIIACLCAVIALVDIKTYRIPDILLMLFIPVTLIPEESSPPVSMRLVAAVTAFIFFGILWYYSKGIGFGDVKYAAILGFVLGTDRLFQAFLYTALFGIVIYILGIFIFRWQKTDKIPFAPFLSAGTILSLGII